MWARMVVSAQQEWYRLHLMHIMEVSMLHSGVAVVSVFLLLPSGSEATNRDA